MSLIKVNNRSSEDTAIHGRRNVLINSGYLVSQRGDYSSATAVSGSARLYTVDKWKVDIEGTTSTFQVVDETVSGKTRRVAKQVATANNAGSVYFHIFNSLECERWMRGQTFTISGWVKTNVSGQKIRICDDAGCHLLGSAITADGTWQYLEETHTIPSNETIGGLIQVHPAFGNTSISTNDYVHWSEFQMELGTKATPFEHRTYAEELQLCQRYYTRFTWNGNYDSIGTGLTKSNGTEARIVIPLPTAMRTNPTCSYTGTGITIYDCASFDTSTTFARNYSGRHSVMIDVNINGLTSNRAATMHIESSGNAFNVDADF